jgi:hypothetical protein
VGIGMSFH